MDSAVVAKKCVACGKDVTNIKRMKDSDGRYWCVECGRADQSRKRASESSMRGSGGGCSVCLEPFPMPQLTKFGKQWLCPKCIAERNKQPSIIGRIFGAFSSGKK